MSRKRHLWSDCKSFADVINRMTSRNTNLWETFNGMSEGFLLEVTLRERRYCLLEPDYPLSKRLLRRYGEFYGGTTSIDAEVDVLFRIDQALHLNEAAHMQAYILGYPTGITLDRRGYIWADAGLHHGVTNAIRQAFEFPGDEAFGMEQGAQGENFFCLGLDDDWVKHIIKLTGPRLALLAESQLVSRVAVAGVFSVEK